MAKLHRRAGIVITATLVAALVTVLLPARASAAATVPYGTTSAAVWRIADGIAYAMERVGDRIYVGGTFTAVRPPTGQTVARSRLAAFDAATGALITAWNPSPNGLVRSLETDGQTLFVGGDFTSVAGQPRYRLAALDPVSGAARTWRADATSMVRDIVFDGSRLLVAGQFTSIGGVSRTRAAAVSPTSGVVDPDFRPAPSWTLNAIAPVPGTGAVAIGGYFTQVGGQNRMYVALVDATTGAVRPWTATPHCVNEPNPCVIYDLVAGPGLLYGAVGGPGGRATAWDVASAARRFSHYGDGDVQTVALSEGVLYAGGHFDTQFGSIGGTAQTRPQLAAIDAVTGELLPWSPAPRGGIGVWGILPGADGLRIAGQFAQVGSDLGRDGYAQFARTSSADTTPPTAPTGLRVTGVTESSVSLAWSASTDDRGVSGYEVLRNGAVAAQSTATSATVGGLAAGTSSTWSVRAVDAAGNRSSPSAGVTATTSQPQTGTLLASGSTWAFRDDGADPGASWRQPAYDDSAWWRGPAQLGYGDGDEATVVASNRLVYALRSSFTVADPSTVSSLRMDVLRDDGVVVTLNGTEVWRSNVPSGTVTFATPASTAVAGTAESTWLTTTIPTTALRQGVNVLAVSLHNDSTGSSDISFDLRLLAG